MHRNEHDRVKYRSRSAREADRGRGGRVQRPSSQVTRHDRARVRTSLAGGVASSWQATDPHPIYLAEGHGSKVIDVDGNEYVDFHNGYGAVAVGHAHPKIVEAVSDVGRKGTHFAQPTEMGVANAEHLQQRFGLPLWRFANSGTESTLECVRLMRAYTGRDILLKIEGSYHGHHDAVMVSVAPPGDKIGDYDDPGQRSADARPAGRLRRADQGRAVQRSGCAGADARAVQGPGRGHDRRAVHDERRLRAARRGLPAGRQGPAARPRCTAHLRRGQDRRHHPLRRRHQGVRRGSRSAGPGQVGRRRRSLRRHRRKRRGHGLDRRGQDRSGRHVQRQSADDGGHERDADRDPHAGGLHRVRAAGRDPQGGLRQRDRAHRHRRLHHRDGGPRRGHLPRRSGCATTASTSRCPSSSAYVNWLFQFNRGVFMAPWGKSENWTLSVQHSEDDVRRYIDNFDELGKALGV